MFYHVIMIPYYRLPHIGSAGLVLADLELAGFKV